MELINYTKLYFDNFSEPVPVFHLTALNDEVYQQDKNLAHRHIFSKDLDPSVQIELDLTDILPFAIKPKAP